MFEKTYDCGAVIFVTEYLVGFVGGHPSNVDYYYDSERGYGCASEEEVADQFHSNFCECYRRERRF